MVYSGIMAYIVVIGLNEIRPMWYYILALSLFVLSQLDYFLLSKFICKVRTYSNKLVVAILRNHDG
jgi:hypothetical protein